MNKHGPSKGSKIYIVETHTESKSETWPAKWSAKWSFYQDIVYYIDTKKKDK